MSQNLENEGQLYEVPDNEVPEYDKYKISKNKSYENLQATPQMNIAEVPALKKDEPTWYDRQRHTIMSVKIILIAASIAVIASACIAFSVKISSLETKAATLDDQLQNFTSRFVLQVNEQANSTQQIIKSLSMPGKFAIFPVTSCSALSLSSPSDYYWVRASNGSVVLVYCDMTGLRSLFPATSCAALPFSSPSGYYWVSASNGSAVRVYCDMTRSCGNITGGWMRVAELNMTNRSHQCPSGFKERIVAISTEPRTCVSIFPLASCSVSVFFDAFTTNYRQVCGKIIGYQIGSTNGFSSVQVGIDLYYVDGISLTHGRPRQHIWTFAAARDMISNGCPGTGEPPIFVGADFYCDTGAPTVESVMDNVLFADNPLWDCPGESVDCCSNSPPWFHKQLPQPTTDNIEMRVCRDEEARFEDIAIESVEIYTRQ